jgi:hypothetical protein
MPITAAGLRDSAALTSEDLKDHQASDAGHLDHRDRKDHRDHRDHKDHKDHKDHRSWEQGPKDRKDSDRHTKETRGDRNSVRQRDHVDLTAVSAADHRASDLADLATNVKMVCAMMDPDLVVKARRTAGEMVAVSRFENVVRRGARRTGPTAGAMLRDAMIANRLVMMSVSAVQATWKSTEIALIGDEITTEKEVRTKTASSSGIAGGPDIAGPLSVTARQT